MNKKIFIINSKILVVLLVASFFMGSLAFHASAQMVDNNGNTSSINPTDIQNQLQDEAAGKKLFDQFQNNQITCSKLTDADFEKLGEYTMSQMFNGNAAGHIAMNNRIKQMQGATGEEQRHMQIGKGVTSCSSSLQNAQNGAQRGGGFNMMGYGNYGMMNGNLGWLSAFGFIGWLVVLIDLILAGIWLWKQIKKK